MSARLNEVFGGIYDGVVSSLWRVMLRAEDGTYCLEDRIGTEERAEQRASSLAKKYGDGQHVYVERY